MRAFLQDLTAPPAQTLRTLHPTPSTVSYTVSTRPVRNTIIASLAHHAGLVLRIVVGLATVLFVWVKWSVTFEKSTSILAWVFGNRHIAQRLQLGEVCQWRYLAPAAAFILFLVFRRNYTEESLTLLRGLGIQTSTTSSTYLQASATRFIPTTSIQDILIHEAFKGFEVRYYLMIVVEGEEDVVVVFPKQLPKRKILEEVWRGSRKCLWDGDTGEGSEKGREHARARAP